MPPARSRQGKQKQRIPPVHSASRQGPRQVPPLLTCWTLAHNAKARNSSRARPAKFWRAGMLGAHGDSNCLIVLCKKSLGITNAAVQNLSRWYFDDNQRQLDQIVGKCEGDAGRHS